MSRFALALTPLARRVVPLLCGGAVLAALSALPGCAAAQHAGASTAPPRVRLFDGLGSHHRKITTSSREAQRYFDQGLTWAYAFNHDEAIRSFTRAAELDPRCAIAWWGVALCNGPHINNPIVTPQRAQAAWHAVQQALALQDGASKVEQRLIQAVAQRYADPAPPDRRTLDEAYALAMEKVRGEFPADDDVATLFAEALMNLQPWDLWTPLGEPKARTLDILAALECVQQRNPKHPGASHLYIHAVEAGPHPEKAVAAADFLRNAVPIAGHLVHMPSHIDVQTGRWAQAADQNVKAIAADRRYHALAPRQEFYRVYMSHNHHFLAFASMMEGRYAAALRAAREMIAGVPDDFARSNAALVDPSFNIVLEVQMRFGKWDALLAAPPPPDYLPISTALWRFMRGVALAAKGQLAEAQREQSEFRAAAAKVAPDAMMAINPARKIIDIANHVLAGELAYRQGDSSTAIAELRSAAAVEDSLLYMEPPDWLLPTRHILGAFLLDAGRIDEAEQVYREDLHAWPENGWSLHGLARCARTRSAADTAELERRFARAWRRADTPIQASCLCAVR